MQPIISIVGKSESGKTTLLEGLISGLKERGYRVAVLKHAAHDFELDTPNKDSWRLAQAGSEVSAVSSGDKLAVIRKLEQDLSPRELSQFLGPECDLILTEGFKYHNYPKIEVHRKEQGPELLSPPEQLIAVVTDEPLEVEVPQFSREEVPKIVDLIEEMIRAQRQAYDLDLFVDNAYLPLSRSSQNLLYRTIIAMVAGIKGTAQMKNLRICLRRQD